MIFSVIVFLILIFIIVIFAFPKFSPIPYFPTNYKDLPLIIKALKLSNNQTVFDLGAGDGIVIFSAASQAYKLKLNTKFIAVEINPVLLLIMHIRCLLHPNRKNIKIVWDDMFKIKYQRLITDNRQLTTFYLYISPWLIEKIISQIKTQLPQAKFVSYYYPIKSLKIYEKKIQGVHNVYCYETA